MRGLEIAAGQTDVIQLSVAQAGKDTQVIAFFVPCDDSRDCGAYKSEERASCLERRLCGQSDSCHFSIPLNGTADAVSVVVRK